jgi:hypothetical protein
LSFIVPTTAVWRIMDGPEPFHLPDQVLSSPSLPKPTPLPHINLFQNHSWKPANKHLMTNMAPTGEIERSVKRQKLDSGSASQPLNEEAFFKARLDKVLPSEV